MSKRKSKRSEVADDQESTNSPPEKKSRLVVLLACFVVLLAVVWFMGVPTNMCLSFASNSIVDNQLTDAEGWIGWAESIGGKTVKTQLARTRIANWRGRTEEANAALRAAKDLGHDLPEVSEYEDLLATKLGDTDAARRLVARGEAQWPRDAYEAYVRCAFQGGRFEWAESTITAWSDDFPEDGSPDYLRGRLHELKSQPKLALAAYDDALKKQPHLTLALCRKAFILRSQRKYEESEAAFAHVAGTSVDVVGRIESAACQEKLAKYDQAWQTVEPLLSLPVKDVIPCYVEAEELMEDDRAAVIAGRILASQEKDEQAVTYLQEAIDYNPRNVDVRKRLAASLRRLDRTDEADQQAAIQKQQVNFQIAARDLQAALSRQPANHQARCQLAKMLMQCDSLSMAEFHLQLVLNSDPNNELAKSLAAEFIKERQRQRQLARK